MEREKGRKTKIQHYMVILIVLWTAVAATSLAWNLRQIKIHALMEVRNQARAIYDKDVFYRRWNAGHGGVYVPVTEKTKPNPYLSHIPKRDITTKSGDLFTLINPAYMTRQVHELMDEQKDSIRGHITSLKLLNPINKPDPWEIKALKAFEKGETEVSSLEKMDDGNTYMRLMRPMITEERCLKCHAIQGYKVGDVRGGVSVSIPMRQRLAIMQKEKFAVIFGHSLLWLLGLGVIILGEQKQKQVKEELKVSNQELKASNQQLQASERQMKASNQQLRASDLQLRASNQQLRANEQQLRTEISERKKIEEERKEHVHDLEVFHKANIGREERILELKEKIKGLEAEEELKGSREKLKEQTEKLEVALKETLKSREIMVSMLEDNNRARADLEKKVGERTNELVTVNKYLKKASRAKSEFFAIMSHELRTPLNSVIGFAEVLQDKKFGQLSEKQAKYLDNILTSGRHLLGLINDILDLSKIEAGKMELTLSEFSFSELVDGVMVILKEIASRKSIIIKSHIEPKVPVINADERKIKQIMYNLLSNAVKFTPDGGKIDIRADLNDKELRVSVADTGIGIKQEDIGKLFETFQQIESEYTQKYGGTGLGLALTRRLVELHGGKIWVESKIGKGSTFTFTISLRKNKV